MDPRKDPYGNKEDEPHPSYVPADDEWPDQRIPSQNP
jgi:hypothetical protein